jgi:hypothetical protein
MAPHMFRIFSHLLWELLHNAKNIALFGILQNINHSHTTPAYSCFTTAPQLIISFI